MAFPWVWCSYGALSLLESLARGFLVWRGFDASPKFCFRASGRGDAALSQVCCVSVWPSRSQGGLGRERSPTRLRRVHGESWARKTRPRPARAKGRVQLARNQAAAATACAFFNSALPVRSKASSSANRAVSRSRWPAVCGISQSEIRRVSSRSPSHPPKTISPL